MKITAKAPCRVDMAGGTLDIWPLYLYHANAVTVNFAVNLYASCVLETRADAAISMSSGDLGGQECFDSLDALGKAEKYSLPLLAYAAKFFAPDTGFELRTNSQAPAGAGIGGSSTLMTALVSAFNTLAHAGYGPEEVRVIAQNIEAQVIAVPTGCQDYYSALYGGVSAINLGIARIARARIPVDLDDFNERIVLAYTGEPRNSGINNWEMTKLHVDGDHATVRNFDHIAAIAHALRSALEAGDWEESGRLIREEWAHRSRITPTISTPLIDHLIAATRNEGATAAKVCGAGGGGCVFFLVERGAKERVAAACEAAGSTVLPVRVAEQGVQIGTVS